MNGSSPFGSWGPLVAAFVATITVGAAIAVHIVDAARSAARAGDPFLDNAALLVLGVVLGVGAIGGTASRAVREAEAAHERLDKLDAPPATSRDATLGP